MMSCGHRTLSDNKGKHCCLINWSTCMCTTLHFRHWSDSWIDTGEGEYLFFKGEFIKKGDKYILMQHHDLETWRENDDPPCLLLFWTTWMDFPCSWTIPVFPSASVHFPKTSQNLNASNLFPQLPTTVEKWINIQ